MKFQFVLLLFAMPFFSSCEPKSLHPSYNITQEDFDTLLAEVPLQLRNNIEKNPQDFLEDLLHLFELPIEYLLLVDKKHSLSEDFVPQDLVSLNEIPQLTLNRRDLSLRKPLLKDLLRMVEDAKQQGLTLLISSTYRSYEYQKGLFERNVKIYGLEQASRESARPGTSQHQLGMVVDFGSITDAYADTAPGQWLLQNAWKYGFSLSYPDGFEAVTGYRYENWHYRYLGIQAVAVQRKWFGDVQQYFLEFWHRNKSALGLFLKASAEPLDLL